MGQVNQLYLCKRVSDGELKHICDGTGDCIHGRPHKLTRILNIEKQMCDVYEGSCSKCIPLVENWDR